MRRKNITCPTDLSLSHNPNDHTIPTRSKTFGYRLLTAMLRDINFVIMDYLINEGYPSAAQKFAKEANIQPSADAEAIQQRVDIRNAIHAGDIQLAIERINELNPQVRPTISLPPKPSLL